MNTILDLAQSNNIDLNITRSLNKVARTIIISIFVDINIADTVEIV